MNLKDIEEKIGDINKYLLNSNCSDFCIKKFDGCRLYLIGSFDLCYYHNIEIVFHEVFEIAMQTLFYLDLIEPLFQCQLSDDLIEVSIIDNCNFKQSIICESIDFIIATVKYFDEKGNRIV